MLSGKHGLKNERLGFCFYERSPFLHYCRLVFLHHRLGYDVRWLLLIPFVLLVNAKSPCTITDFYGLSWIGDPSLRHSQLSMWLTTNGDNCSSEQLVGIWNNLAMWAGVADSAELRGKILYFYARAMERERK